MTTQYTPILKLALPVTGELSGTWGDVVNDNITSMVEEAIAGLATINSWTANSHTLTTANGATSEARCAMLVADDDGGGNPSAAATIICPDESKLYILKNISGQQVTLKTSAGSGVAVPNNQTAFLFCDGTNVNPCVTSIVNGDVSGNLDVGGDLTVDGTAFFATLDLTNIEVTNIKAKDGTASMAIADSTGVVSFSANPVLSGGTANGVLYLNGSKVATSGSGLTYNGSTLATTGALTVDGNTTLGNASTDTVTVNGYMGVGGAGSAGIAINVTSSALTGTSNRGVQSNFTASSSATSSIYGFNSALATAAASFTSTNLYNYYAGDITKGAGSTITNQHGLYIADQTQGTNNYGITSAVSSGSNKWNIYASGTAQNLFAGHLNLSSGVSTTQYINYGDGTTNYARLEGGKTASGQGSLIFHTYLGGTLNERVRIDSSGNVGIGTSSPVTALTMGTGTTGVCFQSSSATLNSGKIAVIKPIEVGTGNGHLIFETYQGGSGGGERVRIDSSGNLLVGGTSQSGTANKVMVKSADKFGLSIIDTTAQATGVGGALNLGGNYRSSGDAQAFVRIAALKDNSTDSNYAYSMGFYTTPDGGTFTERARIDSSGNLLVGTTTSTAKLTSVAGSAKIGLYVEGYLASNPTAYIYRDNTDGQYGLWIRHDGPLIGSGGTGYMIQFQDRNGGALGSITSSGTGAGSTAYNTSSDYRLKNFVVPMVGALAKVSLLKPVTFKWHTDNSDGQGFIAHELQEVFPEAVTGVKDDVDDEGKPVYQGIDTSFLVATLTAAIQELKAENDVLKARLDAAGL